jgi:hypothetical protein
MRNLSSSVDEVKAFLERQPNLESSYDLRRESKALINALDRFLAKAAEVEITLSSGYVQTAALMEGEARHLATRDFILSFSQRHCSRPVRAKRSDRKTRKALLIQTAKDGKLDALRKALQPKNEFADLLNDLLELSDEDISNRLFSMKTKDLGSLAKANGLEIMKTKTGRISGAKRSRQAVIRQILEIKRSDESLDSLVEP